MKTGSCEGTKQLQQDFIKDDAAGDAAIGGISFPAFFSKHLFQKQV